MRRLHTPAPSKSPATAAGEVGVLPSLATAEQLAQVLQVTARTVHLWAVAGTIPVALRQGKVVRFHPPAIAQSLGLNLPEFGSSGPGTESTLPRSTDSGT